MRVFRTTSMVVIASALLCAGCKKTAPSQASVEAPENLPTKSVRTASAGLPVVFYYAPDPAADPSATLKELAGTFLPGIPIVTDPKAVPKPPFLVMFEEKAPLDRLSVPDADSFRYIGRGMKDGDIKAIQGTRSATELVLVCKPDDAFTLGRKYIELTVEYAKLTRAFVWDECTRECFSLDAWKQTRLDSWPEGCIPDIRCQINIHAYQPDDDSPYIRAITLGMEKFALPDLVIEQMTRGNSKASGNLLNLVAQSLAEHPSIADLGATTFRLSKIDNETSRAFFGSGLLSSATGRVDLFLVKGSPKEGDAENALLELRFPGTRTATENQEESLSKLWGTKDAITQTHHDKEVLKVSSEARTRLIAMRPAFEKGLEAGSLLMVKAPFARDEEGTEWMWVEVMKWPAPDSIEGVLQNDPYFVAGLKAGAPVKVDPNKVFDYLLRHADGTSEGNKTAPLLEKNAATE